MRTHLAVTRCLLICCFFASFSADTVSASPPTVDEVLQGLEKEEAVLFGASGFICRAQRTKCEEITPSHYSGGYLDTEFLVARKSDRWLTHKRFLNLANETIRDRQGNKVYVPNEPRTFVMKDHFILEWLEGKDVATVDLFGEGRGMLQCLDFFSHLGFDVAKHLSRSGGADYSKAQKVEWAQDYLGHPFFPDFLRNNKLKYRVLQNEEAVDGVACCVLEYPGMDKAWLDPVRGYAVCRRIYHWGPGKPRKFEIINFGFKEYLPGLWLPQRQVVNKYASIISEDSSIWDKVACRLTYELREMTFGSIPDEAVDRKIPPGLLIVDRVRGLQYRVAAEGEDPLSGPIAQAQRGRQSGYRVCRGHRCPSCRGCDSSVKKGPEAMKSQPSLVIVSFASFLLLVAVEGQIVFAQEENHGSRTFLWKPTWRERGDCGPVALFVLLKLEDREVTLPWVKQHVSIDAVHGCSLASLSEASEELGFPLDVRYVNPAKITEVPRPFILHGISEMKGNIGHFVVVVDSLCLSR